MSDNDASAEIAEFLTLKTLKALIDRCFRDMQSLNGAFIDGLGLYRVHYADFVESWLKTLTKSEF